MGEFAPIKLCRISEYTSPKYDLMFLYEVDAVVDHIIKTLLIRKGTYPWDPSYGSNLLDYLFEPLDDITIQKIIQEVESTIEKHPSVTQKQIHVSVDEFQKSVTLDIYLTIGTIQRRVTLSSNRETREVKTVVY